MNKWIKAGVILVVLILLFIPTIVAMKYVAIAQIYSYFVDSVSSLTGLNTYLVKAVMALMLVPLLIGLKFFFSTNNTRRTIGTLILVTLVILYNLSLYHFTKDLYFTFSEGKAAKWYALTPEGVKFFDKSGIDPVYGIQLKPVTPEVIRNLKLLQQGDFRPVDPNNVQFFNPITGQAQVWYYQYPDGGYEFYDKPGYHPVTGETLKPATKQIFFEWKEKEKVKEKQQEEERQAEEKRRAELQQQTEEQRQEEQKRAEEQRERDAERQRQEEAQRKEDQLRAQIRATPTPISYYDRTMNFEQVNFFNYSGRNMRLQYNKLEKFLIIRNHSETLWLIIKEIENPTYPFYILTNSCPTNLGPKSDCAVRIILDPQKFTVLRNEPTREEYKAHMRVNTSFEDITITLLGSSFYPGGRGY